MSSIAQAATARSAPKAAFVTIPQSEQAPPKGKTRGFVGLPKSTEDQPAAPTAVDDECPVHPWCIERGDHTWHNSEPVAVHVECGVDETHNHGHASAPYVEAKLISED